VLGVICMCWAKSEICADIDKSKKEMYTPPHSQVSFHFGNWTPEFLKGVFKGQNSLD
jgi:hypothetical protein